MEARLLALGLVVFAVACGGGGGGGSSGIGLEDLNKDGEVTVLCFGDSITRGVGDGPAAESLPPLPAGYPGRLQQLLLGKGDAPVVVVNSGAPGERTPSGLNRLRRDLPKDPPDYVILLEGSNDVEDGHTRQAVNNLQGMVDAVFANGAQPIIGTIPPSCCAHKNQLPIGAVENYNTALRQLAFDNTLPVIDFFAAFTNGPGPNGEDLPYDQTLGLIHVPEGLHPTPAGYDLMALTATNLF